MRQSFVKILLLGVLFPILSFQAKSQAALLVLIFGDRVATEQFHLSIDGGLNIAKMPGLDAQQPFFGINFGLGTFIKINDKFALTPEFKPLSRRGARGVAPINIIPVTNRELTYDINLGYIDVPVLLQYKIKPDFFISTGFQVSFLTSANQVAAGEHEVYGDVTISQSNKPTFNSTYWAIPVEVGFSLSQKLAGKAVDVKLRYCFGITDMIADANYGSSMGSTFQTILSFPFVKEPK